MDSEDEFEESHSYRGVPATIVLINVLDPTCSKTAKVAHTAACGMVRQYLRQSTSQCASVCLFGTENTDEVSKLNFKSVIDVFPLAPPTLDDYKKLQNINILNSKQAKEFVMSEVLLHCSKMFANCKKVLSTRTIIILSKLDTPPIQADQTPTLKTVEDLLDFNVDLRLINIAHTEYQIDQFYKDFIETCKGRGGSLPKPIWCEKEIENLMHQHSHRHLAVAKLSFEIGNGLNIGVGVYSLIKAQGQTRHKTSNLDRDTNAVLASVNKVVKVSTDTGSEMEVDGEAHPIQVPLLKSEVLHYQEYGGERVEFTASEMKVIKNPFGPPMLKLLGFKPASLMCKEKWFMKRIYFLFPNEGIIEGSTVAFKALHQACIETGMVGICVLCTRVNSKPINVALVPCTHPVGLNVDIGFDVICIPFVENVREIPNFEDDEEMDISADEKRVMKETIETIQFTYKPDMFENPKLQSEYRAIEAIAFNEEEVPQFVDTTKPSPVMFKNLNDQLFHTLFGPFGVAPVKRAAASKDSANAKKLKIEDMDESLLQTRKENGKIAEYTVPELRNILRYKEIPGLPALNGLKKADLVDLVYKYF